MKKNILSLQQLSKIILSGVILTGSLFLNSCGDSSNKQEDLYVEEVKPTKGVITEIEEGKDGEFKILDEKLIDNPEESKAIVHFADGKTDTLSTTQVKEKIESAPAQHRSGTGFLTGILMYSMMSRFMGGGGNSNFTPNPNAYKTQAAYANATKNNDEVNRTSTRTVRRVSGARSGYGSSSSTRSTRSYGG